MRHNSRIPRAGQCLQRSQCAGMAHLITGEVLQYHSMEGRECLCNSLQFGQQANASQEADQFQHSKALMNGYGGSRVSKHMWPFEQGDTGCQRQATREQVLITALHHTVGVTASYWELLSDR